MRTWRKTLGMVAGGLVGLGTLVSSADAQYPPQGGMPPDMGMPGGGMAMPPMGGMPPSMGMQSAMPTNGGGFTPGAFGPAPSGAPADFPNASQPTGEPASPFSIKDEGMPNAFTCLNDPRRREAECYSLTFNGSYINWRITPATTNAVLATTGTTTGGGVLGASGTTVLVPNGNLLDYPSMGGVRLQMGIALGWMLPLEISGFFINHNLNVFQGGSPDSSGPVLSRPVQLIDQGGIQTALPVNITNLLNGNLSITSRLSFWDVEANFLCNFCETDTFKLDFVFGYRHVDLYESLNINSSSGGNTGLVVFNGAVQPTGSSIAVFDNFRTRNSFDGGQLGVRGVFNLFERMNLFIDTKLGLGNMHEELSINGNTTLNSNNAGTGSQTLPGGLLALPSNIGQVGQNRFAIVPEGNLTLSYQLHPHFRMFVGYNVLYLSSVIRPGDSITNAIDSRQVPASVTYNPAVAPFGPNPPSLVTHGLFANGYNIGIEIGF